MIARRLNRLPDRWRPILIGGVVAAALTALGGFAGEVVQLGTTDGAAFDRVERYVNREVGEMSASLRTTALAVAARRRVIARAVANADAAPELFEAVRTAAHASGYDDLSITVYGTSGSALAWSGRPSEIPSERIAGPAAVFAAPGPLGLRLVHVEPIVEPGPPGASPRLGAVTVERVLSPARGVDALVAGEFELSTPVVDVTLRTRSEGAGHAAGPYVFQMMSPTGEPLLEVHVRAVDLAVARVDWRRAVGGALLGVVAVTLLLLSGPLLDRRARSRTSRDYVIATIGAVALIVAARTVLWLATPPQWSGRPLFSPASYASLAFGPLLRSPVDFLLTSLMTLAIVALGADAVRRLRLQKRHVRRPARSDRVRFLLVQVVTATIVAGVVVAYSFFSATRSTTPPSIPSICPFTPGTPLACR